MKPAQTKTQAAVTCLLCLLAYAVTDNAVAQALVSEAQQVSQWALLVVRALAVAFLIAAALAVASGRHWGGALLGVMGLIAAAKSDEIASYFGIA